MSRKVLSTIMAMSFVMAIISAAKIINGSKTTETTASVVILLGSIILLYEAGRRLTAGMPADELPRTGNFEFVGKPVIEDIKNGEEVPFSEEKLILPLAPENHRRVEGKTRFYRINFAELKKRFRPGDNETPFNFFFRLASANRGDKLHIYPNGSIYLKEPR